MTGDLTLDYISCEGCRRGEGGVVVFLVVYDHQEAVGSNLSVI